MEDQQASAFPRTVSAVVTVRSATAHRARMITPELKAVLGPLADSLPRAAVVVVSGLLALALADIAGGAFRRGRPLSFLVAWLLATGCVIAGCLAFRSLESIRISGVFGEGRAGVFRGPEQRQPAARGLFAWRALKGPQSQSARDQAATHQAGRADPGHAFRRAVCHRQAKQADPVRAGDLFPAAGDAGKGQRQQVQQGIGGKDGRQTRRTARAGRELLAQR